MATPTQERNVKLMDKQDSPNQELDNEATELLNLELEKSKNKTNYKSIGSSITTGNPLSVDTSIHPAHAHKVTISPSITSAYKTTTSESFSSPSKSSHSSFSPPSATAIGVYGKILSQKKESVAFFINLVSPTKAVAKESKDFIPADETESENSPRKGNLPSTTQHKLKLSFPKIKGHFNRPTAKDLQLKLQSKLNQATLERNRILEQRRNNLREYAEKIKIRQLIQDSRHRLDKLRLEAQLEFQISTAVLNRQIILRKRRELFARKVEHAKRVMLLQKMKNFMELRRAISENFVDLVKQEESSELYPTEFEARLSRSNLFGLTIDTQNGNVSEPSDDSEVTATRATSTNSTTVAADSSIYYESPKTRKETLSATIRRTKSLPDDVLKNAAPESAFLELLNLLPPITRFTLRELDMDEILSNSQLRHDLVFDADLQFRANDEADGEDSDPKRAEAYWEELRTEISEGLLYRLPLLLAEVRIILIELLPNGQEIKDEIFSNIDVNLISQEIEHGMMDPTNLIMYLSNLMKTNCAPIRDVVVDNMVAKCQAGDITSTMKLCFEILELMKLDYANHQLTRLRPYILENSVTYEWKCFKKDYDLGKTSTNNTKRWLETAWINYRSRTPGSPNPAFDLFPDAVIELLLMAPRFSTDNVLPETFSMDLQRLVSYFNSWQDITILSTIMVVFKQAAGPNATLAELIEVKKNLWILLNDNDSTMSHITIQMAQSAGKLRGRPMSAQEITGINTVTENSLAPGSKIYELMQKRIGNHIKDGLMNIPLQDDALSKSGLAPVKEEIQALVKKMVPVCELNRAVYGKLYSAILEDIKSDMIADSPNTNKLLD